MSTFSEHYKTVNEHGVRADPGIHTVAQLARLVSERQAELVPLAPEPVTVVLKRVAATDGGFALVPLSRPVTFTPTHKPVTTGRFAQLSKSGAELIDEFFAGGDAWTAARDEDVYNSLVEMIEAMSPGGEGAGTGLVYRGGDERGVAAGGTRGWDPDEIAAETPLDRTVYPRSGFLSRVVLPLSRLCNLALLYRRGAGDVRLGDIPPS